MFAADEPSTLPEGTVLDGKFRIVRCIGIGGMGAVYEIRHELTKHRRALKMLHKQLAGDREAVERFLREASAAGRIDNPHITETFDAGWLSSGEPYLVMEYLEGKALDDWIADQPSVSLDVSLTVIAQACRAVHAAHMAGIVHRDLKPENLFIVDHDGEPFVKVLDFGIGKFEDARAASRATLEGAFMGTPYYMSPEQFIDGKKVDAKSDVYSLGVILFECVTGQHPYPCDTLARLATKIMVEEPPSPSSVRPGIPSAIDVAMARALRKRADERFESAEAMAIELERLSELGNLTLPQGSSWQSRYPPSADVRAARRGVTTEGTVRVVVDDDEPSGDETPDVEVRTTPRWRLGAIVGGALVAMIVTAVAVVRFSSSTDTSTASPTDTASAAPVTTPATTEPTASATASAMASAAASTSSTPRRTPTPPASGKPDFATVEEFPK